MKSSSSASGHSYLPIPLTLTFIVWSFIIESGYGKVASLSGRKNEQVVVNATPTTTAYYYGSFFSRSVKAVILKDIKPATASSSASPSTPTPPLRKVLTMKPKPKFKGPESNCASAFDPCYFPRSICCRWQSDCPWDLSREDCNNNDDHVDKDEFCCKYM